MWSNFEVKNYFSTSNRLDGSPGVIFRNSKFFTWISNYFRHSIVCTSNYEGKLFFYIKRTGKGHQGSFLEIKKKKKCPKDHKGHLGSILKIQILTWISIYFRNSLVGQIWKWKLFFCIKQTRWGHLGKFRSKFWPEYLIIFNSDIR